MLVDKLVLIHVNEEDIYGVITEEDTVSFVITYANPAYSYSEPYKKVRYQKNNKEALQRITQYFDPGISKMKFSDFLDNYWNKISNGLDEIISEYKCSGEVSTNSYKQRMMNVLIQDSHVQKIVLTDLEDFDDEILTPFFK